MSLLSMEEITSLYQRCHRQWEGEFFDSISDCYNGSLFDVEIDFDPKGMSSFHDMESNRIVVGLLMIVKAFLVNSYTLLISGVRFVRLHETGHLRFTSKDAYLWGIKRGEELIIEEIARREKLHVRFRKDSDYDYVVEELLPEKGIYIRRKYLSRCVANIMNSLEDGRIERVLANHYLNFDSLRRVFRYKGWQQYTLSCLASDLDDPIKKLRLYLNELLSLATTQLHIEGFEKEFASTEAEEFVKGLMPYIYKAVTAPTTRKLMTEGGLPICREMAGVIYEALKKAGAKNMVPEWFKELVEEMIKTAIESGAVGVSDEDAEEDDSVYHPPFDISDLEVTLDDETYDKLEEQLKDKGKSGDGIKIKREHPKEKEEDEAEENEGDTGSGEAGGLEEDLFDDAEGEDGSENGDGDDTGSDTSKENGESGKEAADSEEEKAEGSGSGSEGMEDEVSGCDDIFGDDDDESVSEGNASMTGEDSEDEGTESSGDSCGTGESDDGEGCSNDGSSSDGSDDFDDDPFGENMGDSDSESQDNSSQAAQDADSSSSDKGQANENDSPAMQKSRESTDKLNEAAGSEDSLKALEEEMRKAAEGLDAEAEQSLNEINEGLRAENSNGMFKPVNTKPVPLTSEAVRDVCPVAFREITRRYELTDRLPVDLESIGRQYNRQYREYMANKRKPVSRFRKEGSIDPRNIHRLAMNKTDVFLKEAKKDEFDGCAYILLDNSGSMAGRKRRAACRALSVQEMAFYGLFPFKIVAFDEYDCIVHEVIKDWDEQQPMSCTWNFLNHGRQGGGNCDEHDIRIATKELLARSERKKLLIVLSDGAPDDVEDTKRAIKEARDKGITVVGIYFEEGEIDMRYCQFPYMYEKDYLLCELKSIMPYLSTILEKFFKS